MFLMISLSCSDESAANEKTVLHIAEETDDDLLASTPAPATHTTEDLFTIIHRFARMNFSFVCCDINGFLAGLL